MDSRCLDLITSAAGNCRIAPVLLLLAVGCGPGGPPTLEGFGETGFGDGDGDPGDGDGDTPGDGDGDGPGSNECIDVNLGSQPEVFFSELFDPDRPENHVSLCGEATQGPDYSLAWTAPFSAVYRAELFSDVPSALQVREGECDGSNLDCDFAGFPSILEFEAIEGQRYTFIADTLFDDLAFFDFFLYPIEEPPPPPPPQGCPDGELPSEVSVSFSGQTIGANSDFGSGCGGEAAPDRSFIYVPPISGVYRIDMLGSNYDTMLHVFEGACTNQLLDCNDDTYELISEVVVELFAGQPYTIVADGYDIESGNFQLNINLEEGEASLCEPVVELPSQTPLLEFWTGEQIHPPVFQGCQDLQRERRFIWEAPSTGLFRAALTGSTNGPVSLGVLPGGCDGGPALCSADPNDEVLFDAIDGQEVVFVAEWNDAGAELGLSISSLDEPSPGCGESLGQGLPVAVSGSTNNSGDQFNGSCSVNGAPEAEFHWVPAASGNYKISLEGSSYDTLLYIRRGDCDGEEIACVDDTFVDGNWFLWSAIDLDVEQGETISIFVDGYNGSGNYELTITQN